MRAGSLTGRQMMCVWLLAALSVVAAFAVSLAMGATRVALADEEMAADLIESYAAENAFSEAALEESELLAAGAARFQFLGTFRQSEARSMLSMVNAFRTGSDAWYRNPDGSRHNVPGLSRLKYDYGLEAAAMKRAQEIVMNFDHQRPNGTMCNTAVSECASGRTYYAYGENIAAGSAGLMRSANQAYVAWREDNDDYAGQGHRRNMLSSSFNSVGIACVEYNGLYYWVQEFGNTPDPDSKNVATPAKDSSAVADIIVAESGIRGFRLAGTHAKSLSLEADETVALPVYESYVVMSRTFANTPNGGQRVNLVPNHWTMSTGGIVSVSGNNVTGLKNGSTTLTAFATSNSDSDVATLSVKVSAGPKAFVTRLYKLVFNRDPDQAGMNVQLNALRNGTPAAQIAFNFFDSKEFRSMKLSHADQVERAYQTLLGRASDASGKKMWVSYLDNGMTINAVVAGFAESKEFRQLCSEWGVVAGDASALRASLDPRDRNPGVTGFCARLYTKCLGRSYDVGGLNTQTRAILGGMSASQIAVNYFTSEEFKNMKLSNSEIIERAYQTLMNRASDSSGKAFWLDKMRNGMSVKGLIQGFAESKEWANICAQYGVAK